MKILLLCTFLDQGYLERFQRLPALVGHKVVMGQKAYENPVTLDRICDQHQVDAVFCTQVSTMQVVLADLPDYIPPSGAKKFSQDAYAGNLVRLRSGRPVLFLNPLERLRTVSEEKYVVNRYISKVTKPEKWYVATAFKWHEVTETNKEDVLSRIASARLCAIDIETPWPQDSLRTMRCVNYTCYFPESHTTESYVVPFLEQWHWEFIRAANATETPKVFQNGLFDNSYFLRWGAPVHGWLWDTFHLFHSWLAELPKRLDFIASFTLREVRFWKNDGKTGNLQDLYRYNALDGWATVNALLSILREAPQWAIDNYTDHEFPMVFPCIHAAMEGLDADQERFAAIAAEKQKDLERRLARIQFLLAAPSYNPGSAKQNTVLFKLLGCGDLVKSEHLDARENARRGTGKIPTQKAKARHPLNNMILTEIEEYKKDAKQVGTYFDADKLWHGRIYYSINPGGTDSGRASSSESAFDCGWQIQNIPGADDSFKQCCIAPEGWFIAEADKAQSEARCVGYQSGEEKLIELVESENDYHSWNASAFFGVPYASIYDNATGKQLDKPLRNLAKRTNHGANYNMGPEVMLDTMGPLSVAYAKITLKLPGYMRLVDVCKFLLDRYSATYPKVKGQYYQSIINTITTTGKLVSPLGWTRFFFGAPKDNKQDLNSAVAHPSQNLSVAILNREWYRIWRETAYGSLVGKVRIKAQIHDSLLFIYRKLVDAQAVHAMMDSRIPVTGTDGVTRTMFIPSDLSTGDTPTRRWSEIK